MATRIAFFDLEGWEDEEIKQRFSDADLFLSRETLNDAAAPARTDAEVISVFVRSRITAQVLEKFPNLKLIVTRSTGYDHVDAAACRERNVTVAYVPGYGDNTVAEYAFGLLLALSRKVYEAVDRLKEGGPFSPDGLRGFDLKGKVIGVVGTGRIGREAISIAKGFGMQVVAYDPFPDEKITATLGFTYASLESLLATADVVTLHAPYMPETHHLLNAARIALMKPSAVIINTARGGLIDTTALFAALTEKRLGGAALDVLEAEGDISDEAALMRHADATLEEYKVALENQSLMRMSNVLISPHNAFNTIEAMRRILETTYTDIEQFLQGKPINIIPS
ncbi:MAG: NAD(P)-dependent oxidoreductase [Patescibacteria group bacterium]